MTVATECLTYDRDVNIAGCTSDVEWGGCIGVGPYSAAIKMHTDWGCGMRSSG